MAREWPRELTELDEEIGSWRSSVLHRHRSARLALLADKYRLRTLEYRRAYLRDALETTAGGLAPLPVIWSGVAGDPEERAAKLAAGATAYVWMCDPEAGRQLLDCIDRQLRH
jgi:hypothetical protein